MLLSLQPAEISGQVLDEDFLFGADFDSLNSSLADDFKDARLVHAEDRDRLSGRN